MTTRTTITLDDEAAAFLQKNGGDNKSAFIAGLLRQEKQRTLRATLIAANREEAQDPAYQQELTEWEITLEDGLADDVSPA